MSVSKSVHGCYRLPGALTRSAARRTCVTKSIRLAILPSAKSTPFVLRDAPGDWPALRAEGVFNSPWAALHATGVSRGVPDNGTLAEAYDPRRKVSSCDPLPLHH